MNLGSQAAGPTNPCRVLSLDGGGAKGFYTLGVLREIEAAAGRPLCECFDLIFGTSTGAIIAALLALGNNVGEIHALYKEHVPAVMRHGNRDGRSWALRHLARTVFGDRNFTHVRTGVGIVATHWLLEKPMIFKGRVGQAHGRSATFVPGFGCTIADAVLASCSAYPFFNRSTITTADGRQVELIDGGYCANNPTLYAIADAVKALGRTHSDLRVVSLGVGVYPEPKRWRSWIRSCFAPIQLLQKTLNVNTASMEQLRLILFRDVPTVRINETFERPEMATDLLESNLKKLNMLYLRGSESFAKYETEIREMIGASPSHTGEEAHECCTLAIPNSKETKHGTGAVGG
jgi:predicted acylesterase/phospholipase RssA